ncbi:MAG: hypothetical protein ACREX8_02035 [Gammaproteobacteria bacterium]
MNIAPIETRYGGCRFRSRTEARWAVVFDHLGLRWDYEPEGFALKSGRYLTDFWLPTLSEWIEIKPSNHGALDPRWQELVEATGLPLRVLYGQPGPDHEQQVLRPGRRPTRRRVLPQTRRTPETLAAWAAARSARFGT